MSQRRAEHPRRRRRRAGAGTQSAATINPATDPAKSGTEAPEASAATPPAGTGEAASPQGSDAAPPRKRPRRRRGGRGRGGAGAKAAQESQTAGRETKPAPKSAPKAGAKPAGRASAQQPRKSSGKGAGKTAGKSTAANGRGERKSKRTWMRRVDEFSAGGLVLDLDGDVPLGALIGRTDKLGRLLWSLPKGHIEEGETAEQAAVREVEEETGISGVIVGELGTIDFWFVAEGRRIHKTVRHFLMRAVGGELSDADVEVTAVAWVPLPEISDRLAYPDERGLVETAGRMLAESA